MSDAALGVLEIRSWSAAMAALDAAEKAANVALVQIELNDFYGAVIKLSGNVAAIRAAVEVGSAIVQQMLVEHVAHVIPAPDAAADPAIVAPREFNILIEQDVVHFPDSKQQERFVSEQMPFAIGMIETQGFTAVIEAIDTACKAANVEVIGKEKLGGGYVTVLIRGDVAAVKAAVEAGRTKLEELGLGKLIASHVIARPSTAVMSILPQPPKEIGTADERG